MKTFNKKIILFTFVLTLASFFFAFHSSINVAKADDGYTTLAPIISGSDKFVDTKVQTNDFSKYLNQMFRLGIALAGALAVIQIIIGGVQYMSTDSISNGKEGKKRITAAVTGLVVALGSYMLLNTLSPSLLNTDLNVQTVSVTPIQRLLPGDPGYPLQPNDPRYGQIVDENGKEVGGLSSSRPNTGSEDVSTNSIAGAKFENQAWNDFALQQIRASGLADIVPTDASAYFQPGVSNDQAWLSFIAALAIPESQQNPNATYYEKDLGYNSVGLLSMSARDGVAQKLGYSEEDLKDPYKNLEVGIKTMAILEKTHPVITGEKNTGIAAYWSPVRNGG